MSTKPIPETERPNGIDIMVVAHGRVYTIRIGPPWASANVDSMEKQLDAQWPALRNFMLGSKRKKTSKK